MKVKNGKLYNELGQVAVLVSPGFGAGWVTWNSHRRDLAFHPDIALAVVQGDTIKLQTLVEDMEDADDVFYGGGATKLEVRWLDPDTVFQYKEYDGSESLIVQRDVDWYVA